MVKYIAGISFILAFFCALHLGIVLSNNQFFYTVIQQTIFKGKLGPQLTDFVNFYGDTLHINDNTKRLFPKIENTKNVADNVEMAMEQYKTTAFLVIQNDTIVCEKYYHDFSENQLANSFSMAKSFVSALIGVALQQQKIKSINQTIGEFLPYFADKPEGKITIKQLLQMSSGMNFDEDYLNPFAFPAKSYYGKNLKQLLSEYQLIEQPGVYYDYQGGATQFLAFIVEEAFKEKLADIFEREIWQPIGAETNGLWLLDEPNGNAKASCCLIATARDFAKFGKLYLDSGMVDSIQIIPRWFIKESLMPNQLIDKETNKKVHFYGYQWWMGNHENLSYFYARGILGQYIFCIPEKNLIIVRLGHKRDKEQLNHHPKDVYQWLEAGLSYSK